MSTSGDDPTMRAGDAERETAIAALGGHWKAGRLDPAEHERRTTAAHSATTIGDLDALFGDLPGSWRAGAAVPGARSGGVAQPTVASPPAEPTSSGNGSTLISPDSWLGQRRDAIMGVTPFVALVLFFTTKTWLWFLLVPVAGVVLYAGENESSKQRRRRERDQRRSERDQGRLDEK